MIIKGFHYQAKCDSPGCHIVYSVGVVRHNWASKRQAKQGLIKDGWAMGMNSTITCPQCVEKKNGKPEETHKEAGEVKKVGVAV